MKIDSMQFGFMAGKSTTDAIFIGVDSNIFKVEDLRKPRISHLTLMFDLENLGQTLSFLHDLSYLRLQT